MNMRKAVRILLAVAALTAPAWPGATASATAIVSSGKGKQVVASFTVRDLVTCAPGDVREMQTFVGFLSFETSIRMNGQLTSTVQTNVTVASFNPCTFQSRFDDGQFFGGQLPMTALDSATVAGHWVFPSGAVVDANLTLTGTDTSSSGRTMQRLNFGKLMITTRQVGTFRNANLSGTVTVDGRVITANQMTDIDANMSRNTSGQIFIIKAGV
jgi:hypothetical protein